MAKRKGRWPVCFVSGKEINGSYFSTADGPVLANYYGEYNRQQH
jgi:hypothetical protein